MELARMATSAALPRDIAIRQPIGTERPVPSTSASTVSSSVGPKWAAISCAIGRPVHSEVPRSP